MQTLVVLSNKYKRSRSADISSPVQNFTLPSQESVELPLTHPELYEEMGIKPPKGVILYGVPGTGKTLLAKAVANQTSATFLRVVGSELIQKYLGDGPKLVREMFRVAEEHAPSIVFIDEIDAIGTKR
jgi:26S proteasome regulatory subunit T2